MLKNAGRCSKSGTPRPSRARFVLSLGVCPGCGMGINSHGISKPHVYSRSCPNFIRTSYKVPEQRCVVNLDEEQGRHPGPKGPDTVMCIIRPTKTLGMACLTGYLNKTVAFDNSVLECINFLDHVMRMGPSQRLSVSLIRAAF